MAGDDDWTLEKQIAALGGEVKNIKADGKTLVSADEVNLYQAAFIGVVDALVSALREREARRLLS